jgi:acyl carrier protein
MTDQDVSKALAEELYRIAPDVAADDTDPTADLRDEYEIDSMDFLKLVTALGKRFNLDMPEADYPKMQSFDGLVKYLQAKMA